MAYSSIPSKQVVIMDVPEIKNFSGQFHYNFFVNDEKTNESGIPPFQYLKKPSETFDSTYIQRTNYESLYPRYNILVWTCGEKKNDTNKAYLATDISLEKNLEKIHYENDITTENYSSLYGVNENIISEFTLYVQNIAKALKISGELTPQELAKKINEKTGDDVTTAFISDTLNSFEKYGYNFLNKEKKNSFFDIAKEISPAIQINSKVLGKVSNSTNFSLLGDAQEIERNTASARVTEEKTQSSSDSNVLSSREYQFTIKDSVTEKIIQIDQSSDANTSKQVVGYLIEKYELLPAGKLETKKTIIIENPSISDWYDIEVKYGTTYIYRMRVVSYVETQVFIEETASYKIIGFLVASRPSPSVVIRCEEQEPPPPPSDFNLGWDYGKRCLRVTWSFPPRSQQDVKKFQIFRRKSTDEPFRLIHMIDFDDSVIKSVYTETPSSDLVKKVDNPLLFWLDREFTKESSFIYAMCCIDAHNYSSNYSMQLQVSFDPFANKLKKNLVSVSGAPKPYPNFFINKDTFVDTIKDEQHTKLEIYFNPEYRYVENYLGEDMKLMRTENPDYYQLQLINMDFQQQQIVNIKLVSRETKR